MVNRKAEGVSRLLVVVVISIGIGTLVGGSAVFFLLQQGAPAQQAAQTQNPVTVPQTLQKFKAFGGFTTAESAFLVMDAAMDRGIWAKYGLDPEVITSPNKPSYIEESVASGIRIGVAATADVPLDRSSGVPVKVVVGYIGSAIQKVYVKADDPIKTVNDLDGKKIGVTSLNSAPARAANYISNKFSIRTELVSLGNLTNQVVALKLGRVDAIASSEGAVLRLVDSGELRILVRSSDIVPKPFTTVSMWATDDLIQQDPDLVKRFVKATIETVTYLKENPSYAIDLYIRRTNAPRDLAEKVISQLDWAPSSSGSDLITAVANNWQYAKDSGAVPANTNVNIEDVVDTRFLP